jgi:hypothetical protein
MPKLYRILWSLAILIILVTTIIFSVGILFVGAAVTGLYGIYRYYFGKKKSRNFNTRSKESPKESSNGYYPGEVIDMPTEFIDKPNENYRN